MRKYMISREFFIESIIPPTLIKGNTLQRFVNSVITNASDKRSIKDMYNNFSEIFAHKFSSVGNFIHIGKFICFQDENDKTIFILGIEKGTTFYIIGFYKSARWAEYDLNRYLNGTKEFYK